jgi:hypothetical protein
LCKSLKRLRTTDFYEEVEAEPEEIKQPEPISTALVVSRPKTIRIALPEVSPGYSLPPPMSSFPVVLYRGPPSPALPAQDDPPDIEEFTPLSKDNRTIRVSPSFTIELVDEEEEADPVAGLSQAVKAASMSDDEE